MTGYFNQGTLTSATLPKAGSVSAGSQYWANDVGNSISDGRTWQTDQNKALLAKIRAGIAATSGGQNPAQRPPLLATPAWTASTIYSAGQVVTNGGAGNLYVCTTYGTSAASGGPSGQAGAVQADNTTAWQYFGQQLTYTSSAIAPVVTGTVAIASAPAHSWFYANPLDTSNSAATASTNFFTFEGGYWQPTTAGSYNYTYNAVTNFSQLGGGSQVANLGGIQSSYWNAGHGGSVTFYTDASKILIASYANNGNGCYIEVDDQPLSDTYFTASSGSNGIQLDWTGVGGKKTRKIRVYCDQLHGVAVMDSISQVWAYSSPNAYNMVWNGDSTGQGSGGGPFGCGNNDAVRRFARMIGCESVCNNSIASSSFYTAANGTYNYLGSAALFSILPTPDVICVGGNYDDLNASSANRRTATTLYLQTMRQNFPNAMIVLFGPWGGTQNGNAAITTCEADMQYCVTQFNDSNCFFIPLIARTNGLPWVSGTGNVGALSGQGNADQYIYTDGVHPVALAHKEYMPRVYAEAFKNLINTLTAR